MNTANAPWIKTLLSVAVFILAFAAVIYFLAPSLASSWPLADRDAVTFIARETIISRLLEAIIFWAFLSFIILFGHEIRPVRGLRVIPYVAFGLLLSAALLIFDRSAVVFLSWNSTRSCFPACDPNDQLCFLISVLCFDKYGVGLFAFFKVIPFGLLMLYFVVPVHRAKNLRESSQ
jgi:hypothetical protein